MEWHALTQRRAQWYKKMAFSVFEPRYQFINQHPKTKIDCSRQFKRNHRYLILDPLDSHDGNLRARQKFNRINRSPTHENLISQSPGTVPGICRPFDTYSTNLLANRNLKKRLKTLIHHLTHVKIYILNSILSPIDLIGYSSQTFRHVN